MTQLWRAVFVLLIVTALLVSFACDDDDDDDDSPATDDDDDTSPGGDDDASAGCTDRQVVEVDRDESVTVAWDDGTSVELSVLEIETEFDAVRGAVRAARAHVEIDGETAWVDVGNYHLPVTVGAVQIDCPVVEDYYVNSDEDRWGLRAAARFRLWQAGCPWLPGESMLYPVAGQRWLPNRSQAGNEPTDDYLPFLTSIYYHSGIDFGGTDHVDRVVAAAPGTVVLAGGEVLPGYEETPARLQGPRRDVVFVLDERGWYYRYSHLDSIAPNVFLGQQLRAGEPIGVLGKRGTSGGWSHLHFEIICRQPSGEWGTESAYPYVWQGYVEREKPPLLAHARPHRIARAGDTVTLDGGGSISLASEIVDYTWLFTDGETASGERVERTYDQAGFFTEVLQVTDAAGHVAYDFAVVQIVENSPRPFYTYIHAAHSPSRPVGVGEDVLFKARLFGVTGGVEQWDFGDGSPLEFTQSVPFPNPLGDYASLRHAYDAPGDYLVRVERSNVHGEPAIARLWVRVEP
ncbi:MAG: PKD domain-containing protein [Candidatus Lernaella stagnicola]|nr:PKD domain-containing protein [Candidatus Lernaella stagnicola]